MSVKGINFTISGTNNATPAMASFNSSLQNIQRTTQRMAPLQASWNKGLNENRRAVQQLGFQVGDFATQIAGGQSAMLAFIQQGGQMLQFFGPFGSILGALLAVFGSLGLAIYKTGASAESLIPAFGQVASEIQWLLDSFIQVFEIAKQGFEILLSNLDVVIIAMTLIAGKVMGAWIVSTFTLTGALVALRTVLMTLLPYALIIGVAILIERFMRLIEVTGGWAQALARLQAFGATVFEAIGYAANGLYYLMESLAYSIEAAFIRAFSGVVEAWNLAMGAITSSYNAIAGFIGADLAPSTTAQFDFAGDIAYQTREAARSMDASSMWFEDSVNTITGAWGKLTAGMDEQPFKFDFSGKGAGETGGGAGGGGSSTDAIKAEADRIKKIYEDMSKAISGSLLSGFKAVVSGAKSLKDFALDSLNAVLDKIQDVLLSPIFDAVGNSLSSMILGVIGAPTFSFAGGGFTGNGARSGGLDGKGGFGAILHPNETVIDHSMTRAAGGGQSEIAVTIYVSESESFASTVDAKAQGAAVRVVRDYDRNQLPSSVQRVTNNGRVR